MNKLTFSWKKLIGWRVMMWQALWKLRLLYITLKRVHVWGQWRGDDQGCSEEVIGFIDAK